MSSEEQLNQEVQDESLSFAMLDEKDLVDQEKKSALDADIEEIQKKHKVRLEKKTSPKYQLNTIINYLKEHYTFRYDTVSQMLMFDEAPNSKAEMRLFQHRDLVNLKNELKMNDIKIGREELKDVIESRYVSVDYHPFEDYIFNIPKWNGITDHFAEYLQQVALEDEDQREQFVEDFKKWFVAFVGSVLYDNVVNHQCFVLVGGQGTYKTTFQTQLMPEHLRLHYMFSMKFDFNNKDHLKYLATMGLVLFDELSALTRADENLLKSTLTAPIVTVRLPYKAYDSHLRRRASFMGNSNQEHFLKDETGSRRFNIYKIRAIKLDPTKKIEPLYAMAHQLFKDGFVYWFAGEDIRKIEEQNIEFKDVSIEEEMVTTYMSKPSNIDVEMKACRMQTASEINNWLAKQSGGRFNVNETTKKRLGMVLKKLGFVKKTQRVKGFDYPVQVWCYNKNESGTIDFEDENAPQQLPMDDAPI